MKNEIVHFRESIDCWCPVCNAANMETKPKNVLHLQRNLSVNLLVYCSIWCEKWCFVRWLKPKFGFGFVECRKSPMGQTMIEKCWCEWVFGKEDFSNKKKNICRSNSHILPQSICGTTGRKKPIPVDSNDYNSSLMSMQQSPSISYKQASYSASKIIRHKNRDIRQ